MPVHGAVKVVAAAANTHRRPGHTPRLSCHASVHGFSVDEMPRPRLQPIASRRTSRDRTVMANAIGDIRPRRAILARSLDSVT
jgi:hypothetical protein